MSEENVEVVRRIVELFNQWGFTPGQQAALWHTPGAAGQVPLAA
jgi:hypothetical protein